MKDSMLISKNRFNKMLVDLEALLEDIAFLVDQEELVKQRIIDVKTNPSCCKSEKELDEYKKKRK